MALYHPLLTATLVLAPALAAAGQEPAAPPPAKAAPAGARQVEVLSLQHGKAAELQKQAMLLLEKPGRQAGGTLRLAAYPRMNALIASGTDQEIARVRELIAALDVPSPETRADKPEKAPARAVIEVVVVEQRRAAPILPVLLAIFPAGPELPRLALDDGLNAIVVRALPPDAESIVALIHALDRPLPERKD